MVVASDAHHQRRRRRRIPRPGQRHHARRPGRGGRPRHHRDGGVLYRGRGFDDDEPNDELAAVITTASARLVANPEQIPTTIGSVEIRGAFNGFSLAETFVLNRYRKRAL